MDEQKAITDLEVSQGPLLKWMGSVQVTNDEEQKNAEDLLIGARHALKQATDLRMELTRPLDESKKRIINMFRPYMLRLETGINDINAQLGKYREAKRIEADAQRMAALAEEAARIRETRGTGEVLEPVAKPVPPEPPKTSRTHLGSVTYREDYDIQIVSPQDVPRDLCEPSMTLIRARVKSGITTIPGVLVSRKVITTARGAT